MRELFLRGGSQQREPRPGGFAIFCEECGGMYTPRLNKETLEHDTTCR